MKTSIVLLSVFVVTSLGSPVAQLFAPFGDFLQGNILNTENQFYNSEDFHSFYSLFSSTLDDSDYLEKVFNEFKTKFGKSYSNENEIQKRKAIFRENLLKVFKHNIDAAGGKSSFTQHINQFADMTLDEIIHGVTGYFPSNTYEQAQNKSQLKAKVGGDYYANSWIFDWKKWVTPIQNQGGCGACVYFAAAAVVESCNARHGHGLTVLSPQQLNDCAHDPRGNSGCQQGGGTFVPTFEYIQKHGLTSMQNYPYLQKDGQCDHSKEAQPVGRISSWAPITPHGDEEALRKSIEGHGPAAVAIHVSDGWARYRQGIFDEVCQGGRNHAVLAVGYGYDEGSNKDYWIVKNQWGTGFGEGGYIRMRRNHGNMCDIAGDAVRVD